MHSALIVEDHADARLWLARAVSEAFKDMDVQQAGDLATARSCLERAAPDLVLLDLGLPDGNGVSIIPVIKRKSPRCWVIAVTVFDDDSHLFDALRSGADGYLVKDQCREDIVLQIEKVTQGEPPLSPSVARRMLEHFRQPRPQPEEACLTPREVDVLRAIAKGYSAPAAAEMLGISKNTAAGYIKDIYRKLKVGTRAEATLEAVRRGFVRD